VRRRRRRRTAHRSRLKKRGIQNARTVYIFGDPVCSFVSLHLQHK